MKVRFYVEKRMGDDGKLLVKSRPVYMTVSFSGIRVLLSTGKKVDLQAWDQQQQRVIDTHSDAVAINHFLASLKDTAIVLWNAMASLSENTGASEFREAFERLRPRFSGSFFDVFLLYMEEGAKRWSLSNYRKVKTVYNHLVEFEKSENYPLAFHTITEEFFKAFDGFYKKRGRSAATTWKAVNTLVAFLNWASERKYNIYKEYRGFYKLLKKVDSHSKFYVYLTWEELQIFSSYVPQRTIEERVKDLFLILCYTGIRFSELQRLHKSAVHDGYMLIGDEDKLTRKITLNKYAGGILAKYKNRYYPDNAAFPRVSIISMNKYLRSMFKNTGIRRAVWLNPDDDHSTELCKCITVTVGVNTFIYNALRLGILPEIIGYYTGVQKDKRIEVLRSEIADREMKKFNLE